MSPRRFHVFAIRINWFYGIWTLYRHLSEFMRYVTICYCKFYGIVKGVRTACKVIQIVLVFYQFYINIFSKKKKNPQTDEQWLMSAKKQIALFHSDKHISVRESHFDVHSCTTYSYTLRLYVLLETFFFIYISENFSMQQRIIWCWLQWKMWTMSWGIPMPPQKWYMFSWMCCWLSGKHV